MKRTLVLMMVSLILLACGEKSNAVTVKEQSGKVRDFVEVLYFHGKQRCVTCRSIEQNTKELVESKFQRQMKEGKVVYRVIDLMALATLNVCLFCSRSAAVLAVIR